VIRGQARHHSADQAAVLGPEAKGHLLARSHRDTTRREAEEWCANLHWLTAAQAQHITRHYCERRTVLTGHILRATVQRVEQLSLAYETRYQELRRALLRLHGLRVGGPGCARGADAAVGLLARYARRPVRFAQGAHGGRRPDVSPVEAAQPCFFRRILHLT